MKAAVYSKLIAAVVGMAASYFGPEYLPAPEALTEAIILALTAFGVWAVPNKQDELPVGKPMYR